MRQADRLGPGSSSEVLRRRFGLSAGLIFGLTGLAKVWTAFGDVRLLKTVDPIVGIEFKHLLFAVATAELTVAAVCLFSRAQRTTILLVAWLATNFLVYRIGLWWIGWQKPCGCLGNLTDSLPIPPHTSEIIIKVLLAYLLAGSYGLAIWDWRRVRVPGRFMAGRALSPAGGSPKR